MKNAARQTLKEILSAPFTFVTRRLFPISTCERLPGKARTRFGKFQSHAGNLRLRNTPLLSYSAPILKNRFKDWFNLHHNFEQPTIHSNIDCSCLHARA
jgi:hypothetical protein